MSATSSPALVSSIILTLVTGCSAQGDDGGSPGLKRPQGAAHRVRCRDNGVAHRGAAAALGGRRFQQLATPLQVARQVRLRPLRRGWWVGTP